MKGTPRGFRSHVGLNSRQDWDLRDKACAGKCPGRQSRVGGGSFPFLALPCAQASRCTSLSPDFLTGEWGDDSHSARAPGRLKG